MTRIELFSCDSYGERMGINGRPANTASILRDKIDAKPAKEREKAIQKLRSQEYLLPEEISSDIIYMCEYNNLNRLKDSTEQAMLENVFSRIMKEILEEEGL